MVRSSMPVSGGQGEKLVPLCRRAVVAWERSKTESWRRGIILAAALFLIMDGHDDVSKREGTATRVNLEESGAACDGSPKADNTNANVIPCKVSHVDDSTIIDALVENLNVDESTMPSDPIVQWTSIPSQHPMLELRVQENWVKHGLKRIMMNSKGFFFFKFDSWAGVEAVLEGGPWLIRNSPIILKKWSMDTRLLKEELTRISIWLKLHDVPIQVFEEDGISLIATFIGKYVMLDSNTSSMCNDSWGRSSFARCLIEVNLEADLVDVVTIGIPSLIGDGFTKETIRVEYEWRPPRCDICKIFGHVHDHCPNKVVSPPIVTTSNVVTPTVEKRNDSFETVSKKKKRKGKSKSTNGSQFAGSSVKQNVRYGTKGRKLTSTLKKVITNGDNPSTSSSMLKTSGTYSKKDNIPTSNSYSVLNAEQEEEEEDVENVYDESDNLSTKTSGRSYFTPAIG
ncbi:zinc knuckle CX2CX4HX4C containing protein [Tanacetum coccineum]